MILFNSINKISFYSLLLTTIALISYQLSFMFGGIVFLDALVYLLVPAFLLFLTKLILQSASESNDFRIAFFVLLGCIVAALLSKLKFVLGTINDNYHTVIMASHAIKNSFDIRWLCLPDGAVDWRFYLLSNIEGIWGVLWRWTHWDMVVPITQALPLLVLWNELVNFFRSQGVNKTAGYLALIVILSAETFWSQQGSTYVDSLVGIFGIITILYSYRLLADRTAKISFEYLWGFALVINLFMNAKLSGFPFCLLGIYLVWQNAKKHLKNKERWFVISILLVGICYFTYHQTQAYLKKFPSDMLAPMNMGDTRVSKKNVGGYYESVGFDKLREYGITIRPAYLLVSRLGDYKYKPYVTPEPMVRGRGVVWTYFVFPVLLYLLFVGIRRPKESIDVLKKPVAIIFWILIIYYLVVSSSIVTRYMLAMDAFIMAWCLMVVFKNIESSTRQVWFKSTYIFSFILITFAFINYLNSMDGDMFLKGNESFIKDQVNQFPHFLRGKHS